MSGAKTRTTGRKWEFAGENRVCVPHTLPLYELALLTSAHVRDQGLTDVSLSIVTPERAPLDDFGPAVSTSVTRLLEERGITLVTGTDARAPTS